MVQPVRVHPVLCLLAIMLGTAYFWVNWDRTPDIAVRAPWFFGLIGLYLCVLCQASSRECHLTGKILEETRAELKTATWLLRLSVNQDDAGVAQALSNKARELQMAFKDEANYQCLSTQARHEHASAFAEARKEVEVSKRTFWELVDQAKSAGYDSTGKTSFSDFILPVKKYT